MSRILYLDCFSGASGDMLLGALLDAGASEDVVRASLDGLGQSGWDLQVAEVVKGGIRATRATVTVTTEQQRTYAEIAALIGEARLPESVRQRAADAFRILGEAEAKVHGTDLDQVHFHEVGALDAIVDIVGVSAAFSDLAPDLVVCSEIRTGTGTARTAHGVIPVPGPAVIEILEGASLRIEGEGELLTPTGAALLAANVDSFGAPPGFRLKASGYGAGARDTESPNVLRAVIGDTDVAEPTGEHLLIETNLDDMIPELVPHAIERLMIAGAQDAWTTPIVMKKGRPALTLSVLATRDRLDRVLDVIYSETTTLGTRMRTVAKHELERHWATVTIEGHEVRVKLGRHEGRVTSVAPEFEDARKVAQLLGLPLKEVYRRAVEGLERD